MFALLINAPGVVYGPGLTMAPGYIEYGSGFVDCEPVYRPVASRVHCPRPLCCRRCSHPGSSHTRRVQAGSDAHIPGFGMRAINTKTTRSWVNGTKTCGTASKPFAGLETAAA